MKVVKEPVGVVGAILPWNYPFEIIIAKLGQALATGNTDGHQARPRHPVERHPHRPADRRADRHPAPGSSTSVTVVGPPASASSWSSTPGWT